MAPSDLLAGFRGKTGQEKGGQGRGKGWREKEGTAKGLEAERKGKEWKGGGRMTICLSFKIFWLRP